MQEKSIGPFKKGIKRERKELLINPSWTLTALILILITQVPTALRSTIDVFCIFTFNETKSSKIELCKRF